MDTISREQRSRNMSRIKSRNTRPEKAVRSALYQLGYRFRISPQSLPGRPDIVLTRHRIAVFVHGCFWHHHRGCPNAAVPDTRAAFWKAKFASNADRDRFVEGLLRAMGWCPVIVWECETEAPEILRKKLRQQLRLAKSASLRV
jgi:DNA mismatch endonuclease (patch repair protein)